MRWVVLVLALGGAGGSGFIGYKWFSDTESRRNDARVVGALAKSDPAVRRALGLTEYDAKRKACFFFMGGAVLGILGAFLALSRRGILAALVLIVAFAAPPVLAHEWLLEVGERMVGLGIFTGALLLAGLLAFFVRPKKVIPEDERAYAGV